MQGVTAASVARSTQVAAAIRATVARPAPLEEARESAAAKAAEFRQAPASNPITAHASPEGVGKAVDTAA